MNHASDEAGTDEGGTDDADGEAEWITSALIKAVQSVASLDYSLCRGDETEEWLLLRRDAYVENPEVIAEYPRDQDIYQMVRLAVTTVEIDIARRKNHEGFDCDPSVYRYGL